MDGQGVYSSADGGRNWAALSTVGLVDRTVQSVAACPSGALFAGTWGGGVFRYAGTSWVQVNQGLTENYISALLCSPQGILFAGTNSKGVFRSANAGSNWTPANAGLTDLSILTLQSHGDTMFVGTRTGAFETKNGGATWNATGLSGVSVYDFDFDPTFASRFWAATIPRGIQVTSDGGATWAGMGSALQAYAVALDVSNIIHAGTKDSGVFRYDGQQWLPETINATRIYYLRALGSDRSNLLAGTTNGIWLLVTAPPTSTPTVTPSRTPTSTPTPGIRIVLRSQPALAVNQGDEITYLIDYRLIGDQPLASVTITNAIPIGTEFVPGSIDPPNVGSFDQGIVTWNLGTLSPGSASGTVSYRVQVPFPTPSPTSTPAPAPHLRLTKTAPKRASVPRA